jgi:co-chaperonin GroES (HSP10)
MNFRPLRDHILVEPLEREHSSTLAVISHEKHARGIVIAVGPGKRDKRGRIQPLDAKPGDIVHFGDGTKTLDNCYAKVIDGAKIYRVIQEADVAYIEESQVDLIAAKHSELAQSFAQAESAV